LSLSPNPGITKDTPLIITTSEFDPEIYGRDFVRTIMKCLGVNDGTPHTRNFISSTT
jgi:hypothetical protein